MSMIDSGIYSALGVRPKSSLDYMGEYNALDLQQQQIGQNALALQQGKAKMEEYNRGLQEQNALRTYLGGGADLSTPEGQAGLYRAVPGMAGGVLKDFTSRRETEAKLAKDQAEAKAKQAETARKMLEFGIQSLQTAATPQQAAARLNQGVQLGYWGMQHAQQSLSEMPQDQAGFEQWRQRQLAGALEASKLLPTIQTRNTGGTTDTLAIDPLTGQAKVSNSVRNTVSPDAALQANTTRRGQDMIDARTREANAAAVSKPFEVTGPDGVPVLVRQDKKGNILPVEGFQPKGMGTTKLTEAQGNATNFAARMKDASTEIEALEKAGVSSSDFSTKAAGSEWTNWLASPDGQRYRQAQENWVTANLRKESGAAIGKDEMDKDIAKWFPKVGDGPAVRAQKAQARRVAEEGMMVQAGPGAKQIQGIIDRSRAAPAAVPVATPGAPDPFAGWSIVPVK